MSFFGSTRTGFSVKGLNETISATNAIEREMNPTKMQILRDSSTFFVLKAKEKVHKISGNLGRSISVDSITPQQAIISAKMSYAKREEDRPGKRRIPPNTEHSYMKPAAALTAVQFPIIIKKGIDALLARHRTH